MNADNFEAVLRRSDPQLRLRWGNVVGCWIVERECRIEPALRNRMQRRKWRAQKLLSNPALDEKRRDELRKEYEEGLSAISGRRPVVWTNSLDNRVFNALWLNDWQRRKIGDLDRADIKAKESKDKQFHNKVESTSQEIDSIVHWALRKKSTEVAHGKADEVVAGAFGRSVKKTSPTVSMSGLFDSTGVPMHTAKQVKLELARV